MFGVDLGEAVIGLALMTAGAYLWRRSRVKGVSRSASFPAQAKKTPTTTLSKRERGALKRQRERTARLRGKR